MEPVKNFSIPQADLHFDPPLFERTERNCTEDNRMPMQMVRNFMLALYQGLNMRKSKVVPVSDTAALSQRTSFIFWGQNFEKHEKKFFDLFSHKFYCDHGWLPRHSFQVSHTGCNSLSHISNLTVTPKMFSSIESEFEIRKSSIRAQMESGISKTNSDQFLDELGISEAVIFAGQLPSDPNLFYSRCQFSKFYGPTAPSVNIIKGLGKFFNETKSNMPVIYLQHPRDQFFIDEIHKIGNFFVIPRQSYIRSCDFYLSDRVIMFGSINSNVIHEAALFDKKIFALGDCLWNRHIGSAPIKTFNGYKTEFNQELCNQYIAKVMLAQWGLSDLLEAPMLEYFHNPTMGFLPGLRRKEIGLNPFV